MNCGLRIGLVLLVWGLPVMGQACEPIVPLVQLLSGPTLAGPALVTKSLLWLGVAVTIKCGAFAFLERRIPWRRAVLFMLLANVLSTIPGVLIAVFAGAGPGLLFTLALLPVYCLGWLVRRRVARVIKLGQPSWVVGSGAALAFTAFFFVSVLCFHLAQEALAGGRWGGYWIMKFLFVTLVACTGILISTVLEEYVIAGCARWSLGNQSFFRPVLRANYIMLGVILLVAAVEMVPKRLQAPHGIVASCRYQMGSPDTSVRAW